MCSHKIDKLQGIIFTRASGTPTTVTMIDHIQNVLNDPDFDPKYNSIIVFDENTHIAGVPKDKIETIRRVLDGYAQQRTGHRRRHRHNPIDRHRRVPFDGKNEGVTKTAGAHWWYE